jgi:DNA gyrase/topoisomerase IV subunit A
MEERLNDIRVRCRLNILRLYPAHRQAALTDRTDFNAWKAKNVAHMQKLIASGTEEIDEGWPDPDAHETVAAPKKTNIEKAIEEQAETPPEAIADIYEAYGMDPDALFKLHTDLTSKIAGNLATSDERALQSRLTPHVPWIKKRAKSIEVV